MIEALGECAINGMGDNPMNNYMRKILQLTVIVIILTGVLSSCLLPLRKNGQADRGTRESRQGRVTDQSESESSETETEIEVEVTSLAEPEEVVADFLASLRAADCLGEVF